MAAQNGLDFEGEFNNAIDGLFKNNILREISPTDLRALPTAIRESYLNRLDDVIDEDSMASDSNTKVPTQQSVKAYVDAAGLGIVNSWKSPVINATTANVTLSGEQTIDGVLTSTSRILVKNQTSQPENGIYVTAAGAWTRSTDADAAAELEGVAVVVQQGSTLANTTWIQTTDAITLGSSNIIWTQMGTSVPDADASTKGIAKLYTALGANTDGAIDQNTSNTNFALKAPLASPALTGNPTAPTQSPGDNSTKVATTAYADAAVAAVTNVGSVSTSVAGATITLDMNSFIQRIHVGSATFATAKIIAMSNVTNSLSFQFIFEVTSVAAVLTVPSDWLMTTLDFDGADWTPPATGKYVFGGSWNGTNWYVNAAGPYI